MGRDKQMKKLFIFGIIGIVVSGFVGCNSNNKSDDEVLLDTITESYSDDGVIYDEESNRRVIDEFNNKLPNVLSLSEELGMSLIPLEEENIPNEVGSNTDFVYYISSTSTDEIDFIEYRLDIDPSVSYAKGSVFACSTELDTDDIFREGYDIRNTQPYRFIEMFLGNVEAFADDINNFISGVYDGLIMSSNFSAEQNGYVLNILTSGNILHFEISYR